jgi:signal peptidase I
VKGGILHLNGERLPTRKIEDFLEEKALRGSPPSPPRCMNEPVRLGGSCIKERYVETLPGGREHYILNTTGEMGATGGQLRGPDNTPVFTVPEGHFFFMGDNRDNSVDSRFPDVGFVPFENLIGRAEVIAFSADGPFWEVWNWRFGRIFETIE